MNDTKWKQRIVLLIAALTIAAPAAAQEDLEDVLGGLGTASSVSEERASEAAPGQGTIAGQVFDQETGQPVRGVSVIVAWPDPGDGAERRQEVLVTDADGGFEIPSIPPGRYDVSFVKSGYRASAMTGLEVQAGAVSVADFPLPPLPTGAADAVLDLDAFVVEAETVGEMMDALELRLDSDQLLNVMSSEDLSKYAAGDVADALKRVAGVSVVEGQFAIIRGLEDRYSSTLYNGAPVPSPNPDRQSVPLDLFPSEIVGDLVISKTFAPELPSNSSGGSIDIVTHRYPEEPFSFTLSAKGAVHENALDGFLDFRRGSPVGVHIDGIDTGHGEFSAVLGGRTELWRHEIRYKAVANWQNGYKTEKGFVEGHQPANMGASSHFPAGDLAFGELTLTKGRFDLTKSKYDETLTVYGGFGLDLDESGRHEIDGSVFWTRSDEKTVQLRDDGYLPGFDYSILPQLEANGEEIDFNVFDGSNPPFRPGEVATEDSWIGRAVRVRLSETLTRGAPWATSFQQSTSFKTRRELLVAQLDGEHDLAPIDGLTFSWVANYATTSQDDEALGARIWYEPCGLGTLGVLRCPAGVLPINQAPGALPTVFPVAPEDLGPGKYAAAKGLLSSGNSIDEEQFFARADSAYERELLDWLEAKVSTGIWYEYASRDVLSDFVKAESTTTAGCSIDEGCVGSGTQFAIFADTPGELGAKIFSSALSRDADGNLTGLISTTNDSKREIKAWDLSLKTTLWEWLDLFAGVRLENIFIESKNDPFVEGTSFDQTPLIFPSKYLLFDRIDNPVREQFTRQPPFNDQILGLDLPTGPCRDQAGVPIPAGQRGAGQCVDLIDRGEILDQVNGEIDENRALPSAGIAFRPFDWLTLRGGYSQTVARPSFREIGYYVSAEPGTDDLTIGNPQLGLSDVESFDGRVEVVWGDLGDLFAFSGFYKTIQDPIEQIVLRDPADFDASSTSQFRTFFNNPDEATLWGVEVEGRKYLDFLSFGRAGLDVFEHISVGGNFTWIDARVDRSEAELQRSQAFFGRTDLVDSPFPRLKKSRRLYGQPQWIANVDISFDQPDWGTRATLAYFAISDVLDAAGVATPDQSGRITSFTLDRYVGSYGQLDLILGQKIWDGISMKFTAKNLTDSKRSILYDREQTTTTVKERQYKAGRSYAVELKYTF